MLLEESTGRTVVLVDGNYFDVSAVLDNLVRRGWVEEFVDPSDDSESIRASAKGRYYLCRYKRRHGLKSYRPLFGP